MHCPTCSNKLHVVKTRAGFRCRCTHVSEHPKRTNVLGLGKTEEEALANYLERMRLNAFTGSGFEQREERARGVVAALGGATPECPRCHEPLRIEQKPWTVRGMTDVYVVRCQNSMRVPSRRCGYGAGNNMHSDRDVAIGLWLLSARRIDREEELCGGEPCAVCGLRGRHECLGNLEDYIRSGEPAPGACNLR